MQKQILFIIILSYFCNVIIAQDVHFSQPSVGNMHLNPALAGNDSIGRVGIVYRNQWPNLSGNNITTSVNGYQYISKLNAYAGINYINDVQAKTFYTNSFSLFYGQNINIKKLLIRPALEIGYGSRKIDWTKLNFGDMVDYRNGYIGAPLINYSSIKPKQYLDINLGIATYYKSFLLGVSVHHLNQPDVGLLSPNKLPIRFGVQVSYERKIMSFIVSPYIVYQQQQNFSMLIGGGKYIVI